MDIIAKGQLQHHFWGEYHASIVLAFATEALAEAALPKLAGFAKHSNPAHWNVLTYHGTGADLKRVEALLVSLGASKKKLTSLAKSIDYGEPFEITVDLTPAGEPVEQLSLLEG